MSVFALWWYNIILPFILLALSVINSLAGNKEIAAIYLVGVLVIFTVTRNDRLVTRDNL